MKFHVFSLQLVETVSETLNQHASANCKLYVLQVDQISFLLAVVIV